MDETPHLVAHFMAVGAEKRLEDYYFLRNTYEKVTGQEIQLNRILRMLGEDEISLNWRLDLTAIGRGRSRSLQDFDRWGNSFVLKGSIAYERLRELEQEGSKHPNPPTIPSSSRRIQDLRERRQRLSEQRDYPSGSADRGGTPSSSRLQALAEYESSVADSEFKRRQQAQENRSKSVRNEERDSGERRRSKYRTIEEDVNDLYAKSKQGEDDLSSRRRKSSNLQEDRTKTSRQSEEENGDKQRKSSLKYGKEKASDIELIAFTVRCQRVPSSGAAENENDASVRLLCKWASPSSSSEIDYFTIERQLGQSGEWFAIGEKIDKLENQTQLDILPSTDDKQEEGTNIPSYFRLKAHLQNGQTLTSKITDGIVLDLFQAKSIIAPDVEVLSPSSVQLTWKDPKDEGITDEDATQRKPSVPSIYDIEKKEEQQPEWEKVLEVPLSQRSARIDSLTDAEQCQFRLVPSVSEFEDSTQEDRSTRTSTENEDKRKGSIKSDRSKAASSENELESEETEQSTTRTKSISSENDSQKANATKSDSAKTASSDNEQESEEAVPSARTKSISSENDSQKANTAKSGRSQTASSENEEEAAQSANAAKSDRSKTVSPENERESEDITKSEDEGESDVLTVDNVNEWLSSLHAVPTSPTTVEVDIAEEGFKDYDSYKIEYATADRPDQWKQMSNLTQDDPHLTIDKLKQGTEYKFRFTPLVSDMTNETNPSQFSLVLDVTMPSARKGRFTKEESETPVATPPQFSIQQVDPTSVRIEAVVADEQPATFKDVYDVYSKKDKEHDEDWTKVGTIDKENLSTTVEDLEENTAYAFKIDNITSPSDENENTTVQELKFDTTPVKQYDPSIFLEKIEESLENVVNSVMEAAAGHQTIEEPVNKSLNEVIKEVFHDKTLVPNEEYGFDTLALSNDLQLYRGPKQLLLKELEVNETSNLSQHEGEIIIHNHRTAQQSVVVREENGNTRVGNIDGDIIIRNVVSDVILKNDRTNHQLGMNIVGQAFLRGVQGTLLASKFKGIIVVKNVNKP